MPHSYWTTFRWQTLMSSLASTLISSYGRASSNRFSTNGNPPSFANIIVYRSAEKRAILVVRSDYLVSNSITTSPFPSNGCYLSGGPCQIIARQLSDACLMSHQTSVNSHQPSVRQVPHIHQTCTICPPDIYCTICTPDVHQTYTRHPRDICQMWCMSGAYVVLV